MITLDGLELPSELVWIDQYGWTKVIASSRFTLGGVMQTEISEYQENSGRPITLASENAWITKETLDALYLMTSSADAERILVLNDGRQFLVQFKFSEIPVIEAEQIQNLSQPANSDYFWNLKIKLEITSTSVISSMLTTSTTTT